VIQYTIGDLFQHLPEDQRIVIPHVCNNIGGWGSGFVVAVSRMWPPGEDVSASPELQYRRWPDSSRSLTGGTTPPFALGSVQFASTGNPNITVANMIAQNGVVHANNPKPLKYAALVSCMERISYVNNGELIYAPRFGSALAGGTWGFIEELIEELWCSRGLDVTVFEL